MLSPDTPPPQPHTLETSERTRVYAIPGSNTHHSKPVVKQKLYSKEIPQY